VTDVEAEEFSRFSLPQKKDCFHRSRFQVPLPLPHPCFVSQLCGYDFLSSKWNTWSSIKCGIKVCGIGYSCNLVNCSSLPTVHRLLLTKCWILIFDTLLYCKAEDRLVNDHDWNRHLLTPISCHVDCKSCSNSIIVTWRLQLRCDAVFMTSLPSNFPRFSLLAVIFRTTLNKITSRQF